MTSRYRNRNIFFAFLMTLSTLTLLLFFQNCGKIDIRFSPSGDDSNFTPSILNISTQEINTQDQGLNQDEDNNQGINLDNNTDDYSQALKGICSVFSGLQLPFPKVNDASEDFFSNGLSKDIQIENKRTVEIVDASRNINLISANNAKFVEISGDLTVSKVQDIEVSSVAGKLKVAANKITRISDVTGDQCLFAQSIGVVSNVFNGARIIANTVDEIRSVFGTVHIYRAQVNRISVISGTICLHEGARINDTSLAPHAVKVCN